MRSLSRSEQVNQAQWAVTSPLLFASLAGADGALAAAISLCVVSLVGFLVALRDVRAYRVQVRAGVLCLLLLATLPGVHGLLWLPAFGTAAQVLFGYCPMARALDLMPWNRDGWPGLRDVGQVAMRPPGDEGLLSPLVARRGEGVAPTS